MNLLEKALVSGVMAAQRQYLEMSDWWLSAAPESFLQIVVCQHLAKLGHYVYPDISLKRIYEEMDQRPTPDQIRHLRKRPDISVWYKTRLELVAVVEIKRSWNVAPIRRDMDRLSDMTKLKGGPKSGYMIVYSERKKKDTLSRNFINWAEQTAGILIHYYVAPEGDGEWYWGFCILKVG